MYLDRSAKWKLSHGLRKRLASDLPHVAYDSHVNRNSRPLCDFDINFVKGPDIQGAAHEYLAQMIRLESPEVSIELRCRKTACRGRATLVKVLLAVLVLGFAIGVSKARCAQNRQEHEQTE
jgi:hypothetical protein